ncbi:beta-ketoacyl synthase N-terminal-like domain-containing protein [Streptomyces sp. HK10]|uniref:type I polyketide synthase n=1 Tax=Streptomyces sp. HK10 TaxID=3373255 RepID=UPI00374866D8
MTSTDTLDSAESDIAVVAVEGRFPGAPSIGEFWELLKDGRESIRPVSDRDYLAAGGAPAGLTDPHLVRVECTLDDIDLFDAEFFGFQPAEAELLDPQQRIFIECAYHAFEKAGCVPGDYDGAIGVYAGASQSQYYLHNVHPTYARRPGTVDSYIGSVANASSALVTRVSYLLNLTGPSVAVQTACSTSLVAVHMACQDLLDYRCDLALAGGASVNPAARLGYQYVPDGPFSPDGHCRPYSADAAGMSPGDGVGVVLLKRLPDALADGDTVRAVIKGSAVNNDGSRKVGFTAPSVKGQRDVIVAAQTAAGVSADAIGYVEGHGTATPVGDPIEVSALTKAFASSTDRTGFCALGSVKSNLGHLDAAAGIAGLIKAVLALENEAIPPTLHFSEPNKLIDFESSPFVVADALREWPRSGVPRLAGVSSFGVGGTNAHVVLAEAPPQPVREHDGRPEVVLLSAATPGALDDLGQRLGEHVSREPGVHLGDLAHTLQSGRRPMNLRRAVVADSPRELAGTLAAAGGHRAETGGQPRDVVFMYPGAGSQYQRMGQQLYRRYPVYRREMDRCAEIVSSACGMDLLEALYPAGDAAPRRDNVDLPACRYPAIVATEWSLTALLASWGIRPAMMIGHSLGEYTAACVAGVMTLEEMLPLVAERERLIRRAGGMTLSVLLDEEEIGAHLLPGTSLAGTNAPGMCTVSGASEAILEMEKRLTAQGIDQHRLRVPGAVHSVALDPVLDDLRDALKRVSLRAPEIPVLSNLTGDRLTPEMACDPEYWVRHTRETVRFTACLRSVPAERPPVLLEAGPSGGLIKLAQYTLGDSVPAVPAIRHAYAEQADARVLLNAAARLWANGVDVDWEAARGERSARSVPLPGYPFQRRRFWVERAASPADAARPEQAGSSPLTARTWSGSGAPEAPSGGPRTAPVDTALVLLGRGELEVPPSAVRDTGTRVVTVRFGERSGGPRTDSHVLDPARPLDVRALCEEVWPDGARGARVGVLDLSAVTGHADPLERVRESARFVEGLLTALGEREDPLRLVTVSHDAFDLTGRRPSPENRLPHGLAHHWRHENSRVDATVVDLDSSPAADDGVWPLLLRELGDPDPGPAVAYRGRYRWTSHTTAVAPEEDGPGALPRDWAVHGGLRMPALRYAAFLAAAADGEVAITAEAGETGGRPDAGDHGAALLERLGARVGGTGADGARPALLRVLDEEPDAETAARTTAWLKDLWRQRDERRFGAVVLVDPVGDRPSPEQAAVGSFAEACVESAAAEGLAWRLLRWRKGPEWLDRDELTDGDSGGISARGRLGADAFAAALRATGHPVLTVSAGSGATTAAERRAAGGPAAPDAPSTHDPDGGRARPPLSTPYARPRNDLERRVADIWREALGLDAIGVDDNFFEIGGESLLLMRIVAKLREHFTVTMSIRQMYINDRLTIAGMAAVLEEKTT